MKIEKIISGAQTGADRAALDAAIECKIDHGGWVPRGRIAEDGIIPQIYHVMETSKPDYEQRTEMNVLEADGTLILSHGILTGGSALTMRLAEKHGRPYLHVDLNKTSETQTALDVVKWIDKNRILILNVAGSRSSKDPEIYAVTRNILKRVIMNIKATDQYF